MLQITIPRTECYDEETNTFFTINEQTLHLEHSLISISKWESKWHKPFISKEDRTAEETRDYIRCMTIESNVNPNVYLAIPASTLEKVKWYISESMTATWFKEDKNAPKGGKKVITSEVIYYWMISQNIPIECEKWHLNRLFTLIRVCSEKNRPQKKMSRKEHASWQRAENARRQAAYHSKG